MHNLDVDLLNQSKVASLILQVMDVEPQQTLSCPSTNDMEHCLAPTTQKKVAVVVPFVEEVEVINCTNKESCNSKRHMLENSTDGACNDNNEGVNKGIPLSAALKRHMSVADLAMDAPHAPILDVVRVFLINAAPLSTPAMDKFYNIVVKAPHPKAIISKKELG